MKKYQDLAEANQKYVDSLRHRLVTLRKKQDTLQFEINHHIDPLTLTPNDLADEQAAVFAEIAELEWQINDAYAAVPFAATAQKGVAAFWREVGGRL